MAAAAEQVRTETVTLDGLIARAVERWGKKYEGNRAKGERIFDVIVFGDPFDEGYFVIERYDNKVVVHMPNQPEKKRSFVMRISFTDLMTKIYRTANPVTPIPPRPPVENGLVTLHKLGRPFDWIDLYLGLGLAPDHAKGQLLRLLAAKKIRQVPTFTGSQRYEVITQNSPDLFPPPVVDETPDRDQWNAEWLDALDRRAMMRGL